MAAESEEIEQVQSDVERDEEQFQRGKLQRPPAIAQVGKGDALECIDSHAGRHQGDVFGVCRVAHHGGEGVQSEQDGGHEDQPHAAHRYECGGIHAQGILLAFVDEAEKRRLHAECQQHEQQRHIAVNFRHNAVTARFHRKFCRIERYQQVVQKASHDATQTVDHRVLHQGFQ